MGALKEDCGEDYVLKYHRQWMLVMSPEDVRDYITGDFLMGELVRMEIVRTHNVGVKTLAAISQYLGD